MARPKANSNFFSEWSSDMAYILGIIATDGCLVENKNGYHGLNITSKDLDLLQIIKSKMESGHKITKKERGYALQIRDQKIYKDLLSFGLTPRKSKTLKFPSVPVEYLSDFIRGCFDGDGGVTIWKDMRWRGTWQIRVTFCSGSYEFLKSMRQELHAVGGLEKGKIWYTGRAYDLHYGIKDSLKFYRYIYNSADNIIYLNRKKKKFDNFLYLRGCDT